MSGVAAVVVDVAPFDDDELERLVQITRLRSPRCGPRGQARRWQHPSRCRRTGSRSGTGHDRAASPPASSPCPHLSHRSSASPTLIGRRIDVPLLRRVEQMAGDDVLHALEVATDAGLLRVDDGGAVFARDDLVREAAERSVPSIRRPSIHAAIAEVLEGRAGP